MPAGWLLDLTRTLSRLHLAAPTGIDRVEIAWLAHLSATGLPLHFLARVGGRQYLMDRAGGQAALAGRGLLDLRARLSRRPEAVRRAEATVRALALGSAAETEADALLARHLRAGWVYANVGHTNLAPPLMAALGRAGLFRLVLIHDTIPLDRPDLTRPGTPARFAERLGAASLADRIVVNSAHTGGRVRHWLGAASLPAPETVIGPLGLTPLPDVPAMPGPPRFVILGTVEPRKGHAFLLDLWERLGPAAPELHVIGRAGWAAPALLDRLARAVAPVHWHREADDRTAAAYLRGARALLMPSLAEGYGLPLAEALALGVPAIVSDLPALREVGGDVPIYLAPDDAAAWLAAIRAVLDTRSPERARQLTRLQVWRPNNWHGHFTAALAALP